MIQVDFINEKGKKTSMEGEFAFCIMMDGDGATHSLLGTTTVKSFAYALGYSMGELFQALEGKNRKDALDFLMKGFTDNNFSK